jgi:hypothetical protein
MARTTAATRSGGWSVGLGGFGFGAGTARAAATAALEVGGVPAAALQLETGSGNLLKVGFCTAGRTGGERGIAHLLKVVFLMAASAAAILVDRHDELRKGQLAKFSASQHRAKQTRSCPLGGGRRCFKAAASEYPEVGAVQRGAPVEGEKPCGGQIRAERDGNFPAVLAQDNQADADNGADEGG